MQVEEILERCEASNAIRQVGYPVMPEVERAQVGELADLFGDFCEMVIGEDQRIEICFVAKQRAERR